MKGEPSAFADRRVLLAEFLEAERLRGRRSRWLDLLRLGIPRFFSFLDERGMIIEEFGFSGAILYQESLLASVKKNGAPYSPRTVRSALSTANAFCAWLAKRGVIAANPFPEIRRVREDRTIPSGILKEKELASLLDSLASSWTAGGLKTRMRRYKAHVLAELLYSSGLRIGEAAALAVDDVDVNRALIRVVEGKGGRERTAFLSEYARDVLRLYLDRMRPLLATQWHEGKDRVFLSCFDLVEHMMNEELARVASELDLKVPTCHSLRHAFGFHLLRSGCSIRWISEFLGHRLLRTTEIYTRVERDDLAKVLDRCHPRTEEALV